MHGIYMALIICLIRKSETISEAMLILKYNGSMIRLAISYSIQPKRQYKQSNLMLEELHKRINSHKVIYILYK